MRQASTFFSSFRTWSKALECRLPMSSRSSFCWRRRAAFRSSAVIGCSESISAKSCNGNKPEPSKKDFILGIWQQHLVRKVIATKIYRKLAPKIGSCPRVPGAALDGPPRPESSRDERSPRGGPPDSLSPRLRGSGTPYARGAKCTGDTTKSLPKFILYSPLLRNEAPPPF